MKVSRAIPVRMRLPSFVFVFCATWHVSAAVPGDVVYFRPVQHASIADLQLYVHDARVLMKGNAFATSVLDKVVPTNGVSYFHLSYESRDAFAAPVFNTAAVLIPVLPEEEWRRTRKKPTLLYNHGTVAMDEEAPTSSRMCTGVGRSQGCSLTTSSVARASLWASVGYHVVLPDYEKLGLNASRGVHPYCQQQSYVRSTEDLLTALASIASLALSRRLIVAGYSEGGYASLAIHRGMELAKAKGAFTVIASFPQGGPLDWKYQVQHSILTYLNRENDAYWYIPYTIVAALEYNNFNRLYPTIFLPPYDTTLRTLYDRKTSVKTIESSIPKNGSDGVFLSGLRDAFLSHTLPNNIQALVVDQNNLLADTPEGTSWVPTAPILFCSGIDDEQVPVENTKRAHHALKARGAKVTLDLFPGDHVTNARNCLFALSRYLAVIDWETFGDTIPPISAQVRPNLLPVGVWYVLISVLAALVVQTSWSIVAMRSGGRCPTLFELWLNAFLAYPFVMLFVFLALNIGISLYGIAQSNWSINVDSDFANYLEADSELHFFEVSLATARKDSTFQKAVNERRLRHTDRRLRQERTQELKYWKLDLFYQRLDGTNIFSADSLNEIRTIERQLQAFQGYESFCHRTYDTIHTDGACTLPDSTVNIFFPTRVINGSRVEIEYNGKGVLTAIDHTLRAWARDGIFWYADRFFNARNLTSSYTRSQFRGGLPLHGHSTCCPGGTLDHEQKKKSDDFLRRLYDQFLIKINDGRTLVRVTWRESSVLTGYEVDQHLYFDALLSVGSLVFVSLFMFWYTTSAFLTTFAMLGILLSFPMAYFVFYVLVGIQKMMILNFVSLFLIMGIGADDVFVLFNAFEQSRAVLGTGASLQTRVKWAYEKAGAAMLITTTTTVGSFYANMFSTVRVIREFGLFMGTVTVFNFVNVMTLFPAAILVREKCRCSPRCQRQRRPPRPTASPSAIVPASGLRQVFSFQMENEEELHSIERMFRRRVSPCIQRYRYLSLCIACALTGIFGGLGALYFKTSTGPPVVFLEDINLGRVNAFVRATFGANTPEDLDRASVAFPKYKDVIQKGCPGLLPDGFTSCTGNGECNYDSLACECNEDFAGFACERSAETATISLPPNQNVVLDYYALDGGIYSKAIDFENRGDEDLVWTLTVAGTSTTLPSWISFTKGFPQVGIVKKLVQTTEGGARSFHKHSLAYDIIVGSETPGFKDVFFFKISNGDPRQDRTFTVRLTKIPLPQLTNLDLLYSLSSCTRHSIEFQKGTRMYSQQVPYSCVNVTIEATVENAFSDSLQLQVDGSISTMFRPGNGRVYKSAVVSLFVGSTNSRIFSVVVKRKLSGKTLAQSDYSEGGYSIQLIRDVTKPSTTTHTAVTTTDASLTTTAAPPTTTAAPPTTTDAPLTTAVATASSATTIGPATTTGSMATNVPEQTSTTTRIPTSTTGSAIATTTWRTSSATTTKITTNISVANVLTSTTSVPLVTTTSAMAKETDNTLSELNVNAQNYTMSPPFKPYILQYNLSVDASVSLINVNATTNASSAVVVINSIAGLTQIRLDYALAPLTTTVTIHVRAENGEVLIYQIHVYRIPRPCTPVCGDRGSCNGFVGECICNTEDGYSGAAQGCQTYCPGNCYGHGTCDASLKLCNCESTYTGGGCMSRTCPICANGGVCDRLSWSCTCPEGWRGELCTHVTCPNDCSSLGECLNSGICKCLPGYTGKDCSTKIEIKIPLEYTIEVQLVFGLRGYNTKNKSRPVYDPNFDLSQPASQRFLLAACQNARNISSLKVRPELRCWIETFNDEVTKTGYTFPLSSGLFSPAIDTFFDNERALQAYGDDIGTQGSSDSIKWTSLRLRVNVDKTLGYLLLQDIHQKWIGYTQLLSKETPIFLGPATLVSETFTKMDTEVGIIQSTILSFIISNAICFLCIVLFTQDWQISLFSLLTINFIVITLLGFLFSIMQYTFGAIEAVGVTIFVGMSVDYSLHVGHAFHAATSRSREGKMREALTTIGVSIFGGALTTAGSSIFLLFCHIYLFHQLGVMMLTNTLVALAYTLFCLCPILVIAGPTQVCVCKRVLGRRARTTVESRESLGIEFPGGMQGHSWHSTHGLRENVRSERIRSIYEEGGFDPSEQSTLTSANQY